MGTQIEDNLLLFSSGFLEEKEYWLSKLRTDGDTELISPDPPGSAEAVFETLPIGLDALLQARLLRLGNHAPLSVFLILLSAVKILVRKYSGKSCNTILTPLYSSAQRSPLSDFLIIQDEIGETATFKEFLLQVSRSVLDAHSRQRYPQKKILEHLGLPSGNRLSRVLCRMDNIHEQSLEQETSDIAFCFGTDKDNQMVSGAIRFNVASFDGRYMEQVAVHFLRVLQAAMDNLFIPVSGMGIMAERERLAVSHGVHAPLPAGATVLSLFQWQVSLTPDVVAIECDGERISYDELNAGANRLSGVLLRKCSLGTDDLVAILLDRSPAMVQAILGIWKAGAAYLPIDPSLPSERIHEIVRIAKPKIILADRKYLNQDLGRYYPDLLLDADDVFELMNDMPAGNPVVQPKQDSLSYILFTSGSTGSPKGVMIEHAGMLNHLMAKIEDFKLDADSIVCQNASSYFDISVWQFFAPLLIGGRTSIFRDDRVKDIACLANKLVDLGITVLEVVPSYLLVLLDHLENNTLRPALKYLIVTGEQLKPELVDRWFKLFPGIELANAYGPTEASDDITHCILDKPGKGPYIPVGRPIRNLTVYILNESLELCPRGVRGEIYVSGVGVGRGYLSNEMATMAAFGIDHIMPQGNSRMYRTGDFGRFRYDGLVECLGRKDLQVKLNGYRIELGEIESVLMRAPGVEDGVVKQLTAPNGDVYLCGYYTGKEDTRLTESEIRLYLHKLLPHYEVPRAFVRLKAFPVTASGKVDRNALPLPDWKERNIPGDAREKSEIEQRIADLWRSILGIAVASVDDNFFAMGGHSLSAARLVVHLHKEFDVKLDLHTVFKYPTIAQLSEIIANAEIEKYQTIVPVGVQEYYDTSHAQKRLWIIGQMEEEKYIYNIPQSYEFRGKLDKDVFCLSLQKLVQRHETLRTTFINFDGQPKQRVQSAEDSGFEVQYTDLTADADRYEIVRALVQEEEKFPFDLETGPLIRASLVRLEEDVHVFLLTLHHIIADGWSLEVIKNDVSVIYNSLLKGMPVTLAPLPIQHKDYSFWQKKLMEGPIYQQHRQYWQKQFRGEIPILDMPTDLIRPAEKTYNGNSIEISLGEVLVGMIRTFSQENGVSLFMFLLASVKALLYKYSGQTDMVVGVPIAGRSHPNLEDQIGFYINLLPLRTQFGPDDTFRQLLMKVRDNALAAFQHELYSFDRLVDELSLERDLSRSPLFDVLVVLQNTEFDRRVQLGLEGITINNFPLKRSVVKYDLSFNFSEDGNDLGLSLEYNKDLFSAEKMDRLVGHFRTILGMLVAEPGLQLSEIDYLPALEKRELLEDFNKNRIVFPDDQTVLDLVRRQVLRNPDATGLRFGDTVLTYGALNELSNGMANMLIGQYQIGVGDCIAVKMNRNEHAVIVMLAVLKAGACYVPIESALPENRCRFIIEDLNPKLIISGKGFAQHFEQEKHRLVIAEDVDHSRYRSEDPSPDLSAGSASYIIYTSGSTGNPKGVIQTHRTLHNLIRWQMSAWNSEKGLRFLQYSSFGFDASLHDILFALATGGEICLLDDETRLDFRKIKHLLVAERIDVIWFTFSALIALFDEIDGVFDGIDLKHIVTTGEAAVYNDHLAAYLRKNQHVVLHNFYGPSETHVVTNYDLDGRDQLRPGYNIPIGMPIFNTRILILNEKLLLQPVGVTGEIYAETDNLFLGYLNREELTQKTVVPNPFNTGGKMYKTGDFGRWMFDGNIEFLGRKDHQVKIRGFRIEIKEIEYHMNRFGGLKNILILCKEDQARNKQLIAYITLKQQIDLTRLRNYLAEFLPEYMIPVQFIIMGSLPLNINGKVDLKSLPEADLSGETDKYTAPSNEIEEALGSIWKEILGKETISVTDNFFKIGGHSLAATRMASKIARQFNTDINIRKIYKHSTIKELAVEIEAQQWLSNSAAGELQGEKLVI